MLHFCIKRIYDTPEITDGYRVLVDRLWPRGMKKEDARLDEWNKILPPSPALRKWFNHDPGRFSLFRIKYQLELKKHEDELNRLRAIAGKQTVTLLYAAKDPHLNQAIILLEVLSENNS